MEPNTVTREDIDAAYEKIRNIVRRTPLEFSARLSERYGARIYLKREDLQTVRSYKIRGAYNLIGSLSPEVRARGVVCASAGNHAQGVALSCQMLQIPGVIFMPRNTPRQKVARVRSFGGEAIELRLVGDTFDDAKGLASAYAAEEQMTFVHPFDDPRVIAGQGTIAREIFEQIPEPADMVVAPVGGAGLISGLAVYGAAISPRTEMIGVEPEGAPSLYEALRQDRVVVLPRIDTFVDGAAVQAIGETTLALCRQHIRTVLLVPEGLICTHIIDLYQNEGIIAEPAGALTIAALDSLAERLREKTVVCIVSGGNNDISRYPEILERSLIHQGLKHYFLIEFSQRAGALRQYLDEALGPSDDITLFEYVKKNNREFGPALVGIELADRRDYAPLLERMEAIGLRYQVLDKDSVLYRFLV